MNSIKPPKLSLDDIVIVAKHGRNPGDEPLVISGAELAHVVSLCAAYNGTHGMADDGDVNLRLRGLAELLSAHYLEGECQVGKDAAFFIAHTLDDLAARLEAHSRVDWFNVFLREKTS